MKFSQSHRFCLMRCDCNIPGFIRCFQLSSSQENINLETLNESEWIPAWLEETLPPAFDQGENSWQPHLTRNVGSVSLPTRLRLVWTRQARSFLTMFTGNNFLDNEAIMRGKINCYVPSAPVRAFALFAGPIPPELTADTLMTYMV